MAPSSFRTRYILSLLLALLLASFPARAGAVSAPDIPSLADFVEAVKDGDASSLRGIYIPGLMAGSIIPQPDGDGGFVSANEDTLTQFGLAERYGSTGLLAHNTLAGRHFSGLEPGQVFTLVYGDGRTESFVVVRRLRFWALEPDNTRGLYFDLERGGLLSAAQLFLNVYAQPGRVVLQTCIAARNQPSWGRLFVIAEPAVEQPGLDVPSLRQTERYWMGDSPVSRYRANSSG
jgi:hypothetical protein